MVLFLCLNVPKKPGKSLRDHVKELDYAGLTLIMGGTASLLVGLNNGETNWNSVGAIAPLAIGAVAVVAGAINEIFTKQAPVVPPRLFRTRTTAAILGIAIFHAMSFFTGAFYIPLYFQALGSNALLAGVRGLPYSLGSSITSALGGIILSKVYPNYKIIMMVS